MNDLIPLYALSFDPPAAPAADFGGIGELLWLPVGELFIDMRYQRPVRADGRSNIKRIIEGFSWSRFSPLVVARRGEHRYAVIDGQHRAIGAVTHGGVEKLPCLVIRTTNEAEEAIAFATINGQVTSVLPTQIYYARLAGMDPAALALKEVCECAGVVIQKTPTGGYKAGETMAVTTLENCLARYGRDTLITALQVVTQTGGGNAGLLRQSLITATCEVLHGNTAWRDAGERLFTAIERHSIPAIYKRAQQLSIDSGGSVRGHLITVLTEVLTSELSAAPQTRSVAKGRAA